MYRILPCLILIIIVSSCSVIKMNYNRDKILSRYSDSYKIYLDSTLIGLENYYLDSDNIKSVVRDKRSNSIYIERDTILDFLEFKEYFQDKNYNSLLVINGVPVDPETGKNLKVSKKALINITVLKNDSINASLFHHTYQDVLILQIKER